MKEIQETIFMTMSWASVYREDTKKQELYSKIGELNSIKMKTFNCTLNWPSCVVPEFYLNEAIIEKYVSFCYIYLE